MKKLVSALLMMCCLLPGLLPMTAYALEDSEPNDHIEQAQPISIGDSINGSIPVKDDIDLYSFELEKSGRISLDISSYMPYYTLCIYDISGDILWYVGEKAWNSSIGFRNDVYQIDLSTGKYYVEVTGYRDYTYGPSTGTYLLKTAFSDSGATETEDNNSVSTADNLMPNDSVKGQIAINDEWDLYHIELTESGRLSLDMTSYMQYYTLCIYDDTGTNIWYVGNKEWNPFVGYRNDVYEIDLIAGTYYIEVTGYRNYTYDLSTGTYVLNTAFEEADANEIERNNSVEEANGIMFSQKIIGQIAINDDVDFYQLTLTSDTQITVKISSYMQYYTLCIYDSAGKIQWYIGNKEWNPYTGYRNDVYSIDLSAGIYYLEVTGYRDYTYDPSTGTYQLSVNRPNPFTDVPVDSFYYEPVMWAVENSITNGISVSEFGPNAACNRAQVVTFLWRAAGSPEPTATKHPFVDVEAGSFYEKAVLWAVENGITTGTDAAHFSPNLPCNRATVVTFLHRAFNSPAAENAANPFTDVPAESWYTAPVLWAVENGITNGLSATQFGPNAACNRAQIVTFLHRAYTE